MPELSEVIGIIYPIPERFSDRLFKGNKDIFVKYTTHEPTKRTKVRIRKGIKLYFYQSGAEKSIIASATIAHFEYLPVAEILSKYAKRLILEDDELKQYSKGRESKKLLVLELRNLIRYNKPLKMKKPITMAGQYVTLANKNKLFITCTPSHKMGGCT